MHKFIYLLWRSDIPANWLKLARSRIVDPLKEQGANTVRITIADADVSPAAAHIINHLQPAPFALLSFTCQTEQPPVWLVGALEQLVSRHAGYLVTERVPLVNTQHQIPPGTRMPGMNQVVLLQKPHSLSHEEWLKRWLDEHTPVAIRTQSTFGYRQNIVGRPLCDQSPAIDAIVEENFPSEAMTSRHAFYNAGNDDQLLRKNQKEMFASVAKFVDLEKIDCLPMSEYNF